MVAASAISSGMGYRKRASRPNAQQHTGNVTRPRMATSLNAIPYGNTTFSATIINAGTTM